MKALGIMAATVLAAGLFSPESGHAITYGGPDCGPGGCSNPNVVMLAGLRTGPEGGTRYHCSGTLIERTAEHYLFLSAGHCTIGWGRLMATGGFSSVGVSFDPEVARKALSDGSISMDERQFAAGGVPVTHPDFAPLEFAFNLRSDYGIVSVPRAAVEAMWPAAASIAPVRLAFDVPLSLEQLVAETSDPHRNLMFYAVGYGFTERLNFGSNAGGPKAWGTGLGIRRISDRQTFTNLRATLVQSSSNPAHDNNGTCFGDSGGPVYFQTADGPVQVGVTSSGDAMCRATQLSSRMDVETAAWFVTCARTYPGNVLNCGF